MLKSLIVFGALVVAAGVSAAGAAEVVKIGTVNTERVMRESAPALKAQKKIEKEFTSRDQKIQEKIKQSKDLQTQIEKEAVTMSESERRNRERELDSLNREIARQQREFREDLNLRKNEETALILQKADKVIQQIAESEKYDLILQQEAVVFRSPRVDITDKVIKALAVEK